MAVYATTPVACGKIKAVKILCKPQNSKICKREKEEKKKI